MSAVMANVLKKHGVKKGDRVTIYMPMIPEASLCHAGLRPHRRNPLRSSSAASRPRRSPAASSTANPPSSSPVTRACAAESPMPLKENTDTAIDIAAKQYVIVNKVLVVRRTGGKTGWAPGRDVWYHRGNGHTVKGDCPPAKMEGGRSAVHPLHLGFDGKAEGCSSTPPAATSSMPQ